MLFTTDFVKTEDLNSINNFFNAVNEFEAVTTVESEVKEETSVSKYISSLVSNQYQKSVNEIENTIIGNKVRRKRNLQQAMKESFFYGANRFGNNFIA